MHSKHAESSSLQCALKHWTVPDTVDHVEKSKYSRKHDHALHWEIRAFVSDVCTNIGKKVIRHVGQIYDTHTHSEKSREQTVVRAKMVINKPKRNWSIGTQGGLIWGPHLLSLVAIWRKQDTEMGAISFLPALDGQHMLLVPRLSFFCMQERNCNCIWNAVLISYIFLQLCFCSCFLGKWKFSDMHTKELRILQFIFLWTSTQAFVTRERVR